MLNLMTGLSQHRVSNFPIILTKIILEHNKMTLKIEPTRSCEVANSNKEINSIKPLNSTFPVLPLTTGTSKTNRKASTGLFPTSGFSSSPISGLTSRFWTLQLPVLCTSLGRSGLVPTSVPGLVLPLFYHQRVRRLLLKVVGPPLLP